jgi:antibiotic biosynthesis monooxygenase (ABM) superfamily enzyme
MDRRALLKYAALVGLGQATTPILSFSAVPPSATGPEKEIVLYCDLAVDPAREEEMLTNFHTEFKPAAEKFPGYIDVKMLKLRRVLQGGPPPPSDVNYRFQLTFTSEEARRRWIASDIHRRVWPLVEQTVTNKNYLTLLTDNA